MFKKISTILLSVSALVLTCTSVLGVSTIKAEAATGPYTS